MTSNQPNPLDGVVTITLERDQTTYRPREIPAGDGRLRWGFALPYSTDGRYLQALADQLHGGGHTVLVDHERPPVLVRWAPIHDLVVWSPKGTGAVFPQLQDVSHLGNVQMSQGCNGRHEDGNTWTGITSLRRARFTLAELDDHQDVHRMFQTQFDEDCFNCPRWTLDEMVRYLADIWKRGDLNRKTGIELRADDLARRVQTDDPLVEAAAELYAARRSPTEVASIVSALR